MPQTTLGWAAIGTTTFLPRVRTPSKSHATPLHWASELKWSPFLSPETLQLHHLYVVITYVGNFKGMYRYCSENIGVGHSRDLKG